MIDPKIVAFSEQTGTDDMGDVTDESSVARFSMAFADRYVLATIRALFTGGTGNASMIVRTDHRRGPAFDFHNATFLKMGADKNDRLEYRVPEEDLFHHVYLRDPDTDLQDVVVLEWTNPDAGTMRWAVEVGLIDSASIGR